jgi:hypothetical protein
VPTESPSTWIPTDATVESATLRVVVFLLIMGLSFLLAVAATGALRAGATRAGPATRRALGRPAPPDPWASGEWACGRCRSVNRPSATTCEGCRAPRASVEIQAAPPVPAPDVIPAGIPAGAAATVTLEHNASAHEDALVGHWRLRVDGVVVGSAAHRDGALALLRAVHGADAVMFDPRGDGYAPYALPSLIAAFEAPRLPVRTPCPEATATPR